MPCMLGDELKNISPQNPLKLRTIWLSDIHLGNSGCQVDFLLHFLRSTETRYLFLVGDIIDMWSMERHLYWPQKHNDAIRTFLGKPKHDSQLVFIPGNHDEKLREYCGLKLGNISIQKHAIHTLANGKRILIMHGDEFDSVIGASRFLGKLGSFAYDVLLQLNMVLNWFRRRLGKGYWSLSAFLKLKVKNAVQYISNFEEAVTYQAQRHNVDAVVCGHIHHPEIAPLNGILYCNCGDWVESCSALVESEDGTLSILVWSDTCRVLRCFTPAEWASLGASRTETKKASFGDAIGENT